MDIVKTTAKNKKKYTEKSWTKELLIPTITTNVFCLLFFVVQNSEFLN